MIRELRTPPSEPITRSSYGRYSAELVFAGPFIEPFDGVDCSDQGAEIDHQRLEVHRPDVRFANLTSVEGALCPLDAAIAAELNLGGG